jgi:hypothetical protein
VIEVSLASDGLDPALLDVEGGALGLSASISGVCQDGFTAISGELLSAVISVRYILGFRKDNPNVFNSLIQNWPRF